MNPEIKMSVSEADAKQIEEIKEYNSKVRRWCRKIQICAGLLTFLFIILALGLPGYFALHDNASCIVLSFGIFLGLAVISQAIWRIADTLLANYIEKSLFIDEDEECIRLILSGKDISPLQSLLSTIVHIKHSMNCISSLARKEYVMQFLSQLLQISLIQTIVKAHLRFWMLWE